MKKTFRIHLLIFFLIGFLSSSSAIADSEALQQLKRTSNAFTEVGKTAIPAAVFIKAKIKSHQGQSPFGFHGDDPFDLFSDEFFKRFFGSPPPRNNPQPDRQLSGGSGFLVSSDGYILTNYHVVKDADEITVVLNDGREYEATPVGSDPKTDLAVIKIEEVNLPALQFGNSDQISIGEWVIAVGNPFALESSLTVGVVSAKGRQDLGITALEDFIQTDAAINPGNSGGPLLNLDGDVIGINTAIATNSGGYMGIGFAIPSNMAKHIMHQIIETGIVKRAYLGIILQPLDKELIEAMNLNARTEGVLIAEVMKDSPASKGGLENGDIIIEYNNSPVKSMNKFRNDIALMDPNTKINLKILRNGQSKKIQVKLGLLSENEATSSEIFHKIGIDVANLASQTKERISKLGYSPDSQGVIITNVKPNSPAAQSGLKPKYLITGVVINWKNQKKVANTADLSEALKELAGKKYVVLIIRHKNYQRYYTIKLGS